MGAAPSPPVLGGRPDLGHGPPRLGTIAARQPRHPSRPPARPTPTIPPRLASSPEDLAAGLRRLGGCAVIALGMLAVAWLWELDLAFVRFLLNQPLWFLDDQTPVTVGDLAEAGAIIAGGGPRLALHEHRLRPDALPPHARRPRRPVRGGDALPICRAGDHRRSPRSGAIRLDMARIGVVLAALGVGLGFGLQEIISNFVCGIILLLERPIRIGDVVTVAGTTGRVDRIHIRATTIVNADNQSMIVPNREFITGNLVNWTHKDKILRDPDQAEGRVRDRPGTRSWTCCCRWRAAIRTC